jgi:hypothetical protein
MDQLKHVIEVWTGYAQGLTGSIGALAFVCAFIWMIARLDEFFISVNAQSVRIPARGSRRTSFAESAKSCPSTETAAESPANRHDNKSRPCMFSM